jgi:hypothetical protein
MILCAFNGVFVVSLMVLAVTNTFTFDSIGNRAYIVTSKVSLRKDIKISAAKIIQKFYRLSAGYADSKKIHHKLLVSLKQEVISLKKLIK